MVQAGSGVPWPKTSVVVATSQRARDLHYVFCPTVPAYSQDHRVDGHFVGDFLAAARELREHVSPRVGVAETSGT